MALDVLHPELIVPDSGAVLPWREGERGELVLTHVSRECQPLVRFRTGDIIVLTGTGRARAGEPHRAFASSAAATTWWWCAGSTSSPRRSPPC